MKNWEQTSRIARECHTKEAWGRFFQQYGDDLMACHSSKPIAELVRMLVNDPQSLQYNQEIWAILLRGCLSSWNLELGHEIATFTDSVASPKIAIPAAEIFMESGAPSLARKTASRALRLMTIEPWETLQLQMIICNSYVEEGKHTMALRLLKKMETVVASQHLGPKNLADILVNMARARFFLGRYLEAATFFYQAYHSYLDLGDWEAAAKGLFNTAACYHNSGDENQAQAFELVSECKRLSEKHELSGPLSHCYAFYGTDDYQHGNFAGASEHYRKALEHLPLTDKSFRRLHIISMLALTYLRTGRYQLAQKFGKQTLDLASLDESERFKSRYLNLHAELHWQDGNIQESQNLLDDSFKGLQTRGVHTLEELSILSRYFMQSAKLNETNVPTKILIADQLKKNTVSWLEYLVSLGALNTTQRRFDDAWEASRECYEKASSYGAKYYKALAILNMIHILLAQNAPVEKIVPLQRELEIATSRMVETPLLVHNDLVQSGIAYREGNFEEAKRCLKNAARLKRISYPTRMIIMSWLATLEGHSPKLSGWQLQMVARATAIYYAPSLEVLDEHQVLVSKQYLISLERHPMLAKLLRYLLTRNNFSATAADVQVDVWTQSVSQQGWQQKIRNTIMRMRDCFPHTLAPLILHSDNHIRLFHEAVHLQPLSNKNLRPEDEILRLLVEGPMSSVQLSNRINVSQATTKRILKKLAESERVMVARVGRKVFYHADISGNDSTLKT